MLLPPLDEEVVGCTVAFCSEIPGPVDKEACGCHCEDSLVPLVLRPPTLEHDAHGHPCTQGDAGKPQSHCLRIHFSAEVKEGTGATLTPTRDPVLRPEAAEVVFYPGPVIRAGRRLGQCFSAKGSIPTGYWQCLEIPFYCHD